MERKLNSNDQQYSQYQQSELSPLSWTHWTQKGGGATTYDMTLEIQVLIWDKYNKCFGLKPINEFLFTSIVHMGVRLFLVFNATFKKMSVIPW
jgi:hypothetical protein